jgi:hypothetical protein
VTEHTDGTDPLELLGMLGRVDPPDHAVVAAARQQLWLAIAADLLAGDAGRAQPSEVQRPAARRRPPEARQENRRRGAPPSSG